jgi:uncharacterized GH25 family protein
VGTKPTALPLRPVVGIAATVVLIIAIWPMRYLAAPRWSVVVVTDDGQPLASANVRLSYRNYSAEDQSHELTLKTDESGRLLFPAQYGRVCPQ